MRRNVLLLLVIGVCVMGFCASAELRAAREGNGVQGASSVAVTLRVPETRQFELALDEFVLDWAGTGPESRAMQRQPAVPQGADLTRREGLMAEFSVDERAGTQTLREVVRDAEAVNGAAGYMVLYEPGAPRTRQTRFLLTREVILILDSADRLTPILEGVGVDTAAPVPGSPRAFVILAASPLDAQTLADACLQQPGVAAAYPALRRPVKLY